MCNWLKPELNLWLFSDWSSNWPVCEFTAADATSASSPLNTVFFFLFCFRPFETLWNKFLRLRLFGLSEYWVFTVSLQKLSTVASVGGISLNQSGSRRQSSVWAPDWIINLSPDCCIATPVATEQNMQRRRSKVCGCDDVSLDFKTWKPLCLCVAVHAQLQVRFPIDHWKPIVCVWSRSSWVTTWTLSLQSRGADAGLSFDNRLTDIWPGFPKTVTQQQGWRQEVMLLWPRQSKTTCTVYVL